MLEEALARLAKTEIVANELTETRRAFKATIEAGGDRDELAPAAIAAEVALLRRQADHLISLAATGGDGAPSVLFLISDGYYTDPPRSISIRMAAEALPVPAAQIRHREP